MPYILFLLGLPHILEARRASLHSQLARLEEQEGDLSNDILGQLHELHQLKILLRGAKIAPLSVDIPHDSVALYASGQDVAYKCSSPQCPGFPWPTSVRPHPCQAGEGEPGKVASSPAPATKSSSPAPATKSSSAKLVPGCRSTHPDYCLRIYGACEFSADPCPGAEPSSPALAEASEPSSPAPVYEVPGWRLGAPAAGFKSFRCADPECEGNDHTVQLFHGICYRCLHKPSYSHKYQEKDGYQVKVWPPQRPGEWAVLRDSSRVAIAGKVAEGGHWFGAGLPVMHMDFDKAVEFAVFEAEKQEKAVRNA